jgi:hypothetical protein
MTEVEGTESVALMDQPVADPAPVQPISDDGEAERLRAKLNEANKHAKEAAKQAKVEAQRAAEALQKLQDIEHQQLAGQGQFKPLWEELKVTHAQALQRIAELEMQLTTKDETISAERLRLAAVTRISDAGARKPDQLFQLLQGKLVDVDGEPAVLSGGMEVPLAQHLTNLRQPGSEWEHHFLPNAKKGMGATPAVVPGTGQPNPYAAETFNVTAQFMLEAQNPELAAALEAEAGG